MYPLGNIKMFVKTNLLYLQILSINQDNKNIVDRIHLSRSLKSL